jgi:alkylation response protein AidB-like acyl-CoA dehydrogenase
MGTIDAEAARELRDTVQGVLRRRSSSTQVRAITEADGGFDRSLWREMCDLGWAGLLVPEAYDGADAGMAAAAIVLEGLGAHVTPSPFLSSAVLATVALKHSATQKAGEWLTRLAAGDAFGTVAFTAKAGRAQTGLYGVTAAEAGTGYRLNGTASFVLDAGADLIVVAAALSGETLLAAVPGAANGVSRERVQNVDRTRELAHVGFGDVAVGPENVLAIGSDADRIVETVIDAAALALGADALGAAERALSMSVEYAKQRVQFGRLIGSFQAIKHKLADMYVLVEASKATIGGAASGFELGGSDVRRRAAAAGSFVRQSASRVVGDAMQAHGGIGYTWEHDCHLLLKRAKFDEFFLTDLWSQRERLVTAIDEEGLRSSWDAA